MFVGRLDPKADRRSKELIVITVYLEKAVSDEARFAHKLATKLRDLAAFNGCDRILYRPKRGDALGKLLVAELARMT